MSLLGYSWENVSNWKHDTDKKTCVIYGKDGKELDQLDLDTIVKNYIGGLTGDGTAELASEHEEEVKKIELTEKEF